MRGSAVVALVFGVLAACDAPSVTDRPQDPAGQRAATFATYDILRREEALPSRAQVIYRFVAGANADADAFQKAAQAAGYETNASDDGRFVVLRSPVFTLSAQGIWTRETRVTQLAAAHGYLSDGWGF